MSNELHKLSKWFELNKLSLNVYKTNFMILSTRRVDNNLNITINDFNIERVYCAKFLGEFIDHKLTWNDHVIHISKKLSKSIAVIYKASHMLNTNALYSLDKYSFSSIPELLR